jgi:hypothetical protein
MKQPQHLARLQEIATGLLSGADKATGFFQNNTGLINANRPHVQ